tara:strand:+ start:208 stop:456 length:249 start_codon:yes stop_codon:yes gene_type:complete
MIVWGEWRVTGIPSIGDYVQADVVHKMFGVKDTQEGFVSEVTDDAVYFFGISRDPNWSAERWRLGKLPDHLSVTRSKKLVVT